MELRSSLFVCRTWYSVIVNDPTLWTTITFNSRICAHLVARLAQGGPQSEKMARILSFYDVCTRRSKRVHLKITLDLESFSTWDDKHVLRTNLNHLLILFVTKTGKHATRWKEFIWKHHATFFSARSVLKCLPQRIPSLRRLDITQLHWCKEYLEGVHFPSCPNIQTLSLIDIWDKSDGQAPTLFQQSGFTSVQDFTLGKDWDWQSVDLRWVSMFRNIQTLTLFSFGQLTNDKRVFVSPMCVTLPRLRLLRLCGWVPNEILSPIEPPDHLIVVMRASDENGGFSHSIRTLSGTMVATKMAILHLQWPERAIKDVLLSSIFKLLHNAPCLEVVSFSPSSQAVLHQVIKANHNYSFSICADRRTSLDEHYI